MCLLVICISSLEECLFKPFTCILIGLSFCWVVGVCDVFRVDQKVFFFTICSGTELLKIKWTKDRLTGEEKYAYFIWYFNFYVYMGVSQKRKWKPKEEVRLESLYPILTKHGTFVEKWQDKGKIFGLLGVVSCGKVNIWGEMNGRECYFSRICLCRFKLVLSPMIRVVSSSCYWRREREHLHKGKFIPCPLA